MVALRPDLVIGWDTDKRRELRARLGTLGIQYSHCAGDTSDVFKLAASAVSSDVIARPARWRCPFGVSSTRCASKSPAGRPAACCLWSIRIRR